MLYASYNFFIFFLFLVLIFMEKKKCNDYLIGIIIGLCVLTKQSVGGALALVSVYYLFKDYKKFFKRVVGAFIPVVIFLIYIFIVDCYKEFFDLCIAGLFDFGKENYVGNIFIILCYLLCLGVVIYKIIKDKRNINNYYVLALSIMVIPMFDYFHLKFFVLGVLILFIEKISLKRLNLDLLLYGCMLGITFINFSSSVKFPITYPNNVKHFEYRYISNKHLEETKVVSEKLTSYKDREVIYLFEQSYYYKILNDLPITYFDLINTGNWGYDGSSKLLDALKDKDNCIFVINKISFEGTRQSDKTALNYVLLNGKKIDEVYDFEFYIIE